MQSINNKVKAAFEGAGAGAEGVAGLTMVHEGRPVGRPGGAPVSSVMPAIRTVCLVPEKAVGHAQIFVKMMTGKTITLDVNLSQTTTEVRGRAQSSTRRGRGMPLSTV